MKKQTIFSITLIVFVVLIITVAFSTFLEMPYGIDWRNHYKPAALGILEGEYIYGNGYYNPPWIAAMLIPFALLPEPFDRLALFFATFLASFLFVYRMKFNPVSAALYMVSVPVIACLWDGNIDAFILLGATINPTIGLFFVLAKPQVGAIVALFWWYQCLLSEKPFYKTFNTFYPVIAAFFLSFAIYGFWPTTINADSVSSFGWNVAIFPYGVLIGLTLTVRAVTKWDKTSAIAASPFLSTYLSFNSWAGAYAIFRKRPVWMFIAVTLPWAYITYLLLF